MIFCCTSNKAVGCTFLDWSIHFITGQTEFYNTKYGWEPLSNNPVTNINAHGHNKNHPSGFNKTKNTIDQLLQFPQNVLTSCYPQPLHMDMAADDLNIPINDLDQLHNQKSISQHRTNDYNQLLKYVSTESQVIFVNAGDNLNLYHRVLRSTSRMPLSPGPARSTAEMHDEVDFAFFKDSIKDWNNQGLTDIWDIRERRALQSNLINENHGTGEINVDFSFEHYWIDCRSWWFDGVDTIQDIIAWLNLKIDTDRFQLWIPIYHAWQKMQAKHLKFQFNCQHIVDSIVNNWSYPIDLTFDEEVVIQHCLIYQHNLNLKTWQLTKFPNNTQHLHKLLEPNIHAV